MNLVRAVLATRGYLDSLGLLGPSGPASGRVAFCFYSEARNRVSTYIVQHICKPIIEFKGTDCVN